MADKEETESVRAPEPQTNEASTTSTAPAAGHDDAKDTRDAIKQNDPLVSDELPTPETSSQIKGLPVFDREGKPFSFQSVSQGPDSVDRVVVIFIRHFFCGSCQEYIIALSRAIKPEDLLKLPKSTSIAIIGCGDPGLIDFYATQTGCPFPIYADPSQKLYDALGMAKNMALGPQPGYIRKSMFRIIGESFVSILKQIPSGLVHKGGESRQNGGELVYEASGEGQEKQVTWCHRMKTTRDHIEIDDLMSLLDPERASLQKAQE